MLFFYRSEIFSDTIPHMIL